MFEWRRSIWPALLILAFLVGEAPTPASDRNCEHSRWWECYQLVENRIRHGQHAAALTMIDQLIRLEAEADEDRWVIGRQREAYFPYYLRALCYHELGRHQEALVELERSISPETPALVVEVEAAIASQKRLSWAIEAASEYFERATENVTKEASAPALHALFSAGVRLIDANPAARDDVVRRVGEAAGSVRAKLQDGLEVTPCVTDELQSWWLESRRINEAMASFPRAWLEPMARRQPFEERIRGCIESTSPVPVSTRLELVALFHGAIEREADGESAEATVNGWLSALLGSWPRRAEDCARLDQAGRAAMAHSGALVLPIRRALEACVEGAARSLELREGSYRAASGSPEAAGLPVLASIVEYWQLGSEGRDPLKSLRESLFLESLNELIAIVEAMGVPPREDEMKAAFEIERRLFQDIDPRRIIELEWRERAHLILGAVYARVFHGTGAREHELARESHWRSCREEFLAQWDDQIRAFFGDVVARQYISFRAAN